MGANRLRNAWVWAIWALLILLSASACSVEIIPLAEQATFTPTASPLPTGTPTSTPVWFPPTATSTPRPTLTATQPPPPTGLPGDILLDENFEEASNWDILATDAGNIAVGNQRLTIAIHRERTLLTSVRQGLEFGDFLLEITARTNFCKAADEYGLILRAASQGDYYRFGLSCDGRARLDRISGGTATSPQPWTASFAIPPGAPGEALISVRAEGRNLSFSVNGEAVFEVTVPSSAGGRIGVYARTAGSDPLSVSFSDLAVYSLEP